MTTISSSTGRTKTRDMVYIAVLIAICSWISIPATVPFTMQTFGVFVTVGTLGGKRGTMAVLIYLLLGAVGIPVFAGFEGGLGAILGNTGGYLVGFLFSALTMWAAESLFGRKTGVLAVSMVLGLLVCYALGTVWFMAVWARTMGTVGWWTVLGWCVFPYIIPDTLKIVLALFVCRRLARAVSIS